MTVPKAIYSLVISWQLQYCGAITGDFLPVYIFFWLKEVSKCMNYVDFSSFSLITFCVSRRRRKIYCGHARMYVCQMSVCLSVRGRTPTLLLGPGCNLGAW